MFLYVSEDRRDAEALAAQVQTHGVEIRLDPWNMRPGEPWEPAIEDALDVCGTCVMVIGAHRTGVWQHDELCAAIKRWLWRGRQRVIPVLLPGARRPQRSQLPVFLVHARWLELGGPAGSRMAGKRSGSSIG